MLRIQVFLDEAMHARLRSLARQRGRSMSALAREALARTFGPRTVDQSTADWVAIFGLWRDRTDIGSTREYIRNLRGGARRHLETES
jgi:plasmid stability protein